MAQENEDIGSESHHSLRAVGIGLLAGTAIGMSIAEAKKNRQTPLLKKLIDQLGI